MENYFGIGLRRESATVPNEFFFQLDIIEDLAVESYEEIPITTLHRLPAATQIDYAESGVGEARPPLAHDCSVVRPPVTQAAYHSP
jgi:hypothetical protein